MTADDFWAWFVSNEAALWRFAETPEAFFDKIRPTLAAYHEGLEAEVSDSEKGRRELTISAAGNLEGFEPVERLVEAAPSLNRWKVIAFKQPRGFDFVLESDDIRIAPEDLRFEPLKSDTDPTALGIRVFVPGASAQPRVVDAVRRAIEVGLGERIAATAIRHVETQDVPPDSSKYLPLVELPKYIEWFRTKAGYRH